MRITFCCTHTKAAPWLEILRAALPGAVIEDWVSGAPVADYAVVWSPPQQFVDEQTAAPGHSLKAMFNTGAGVDALLQLRIPSNVKLVRLNDAGMSVQMAEYVCHAVIRHFREFDGYQADVAQGKWSYRKPRGRADFPVGVMGLGVLGSRVARALTHFDFPVLGWSRTPRQIDGVKTFSGAAQWDDFLVASKVLVCLLPLTPDTRNILNFANLAKLKEDGYVINVARGGHLVDDDLIALVNNGHLAGATLDVFRTEPLPGDHPFWRHPKITVTPHTSARTLRDETLAQIVGKIQALERGEAIEGVVDHARGY